MMSNVCPRCGMWEVEREILDEGAERAVAICSGCGHREGFWKIPLFIITGASGSGKTTVCDGIRHRLEGVVVLEADILWGIMGADADGSYRTYHDLWLRVVKNINQARRPVVLCGAAVPQEIEEMPERRYIGEIHYLVLVADDEAIAARLRARPAWRRSGSDGFVTQSIDFNRWLRRLPDRWSGPLSFADTSALDAGEIADLAIRWVNDRLVADQRAHHD